jgi:hypothetical protein
MKEITLSEVPKFVETYLNVRDSIKNRVAEQMKTEKSEPQDKHTVSEMSTVGAYDSKLGKWIP